jgi:arylsulfatase A-like enzyme
VTSTLLLISGCGAPDPPRNAILIVLDTLRADRLSVYGHSRQTTPVLDDLAARGVLFESVVSNSSWTLPALTGLLTGRYPTAAEYSSGLRYSLVEKLNDAGWRTAAFTGGGYAGAQYGLELGFDEFHEQDPVHIRAFGQSTSSEASQDDPVQRDEGIAELFGHAEKWLDENHADPFFLMIHTYEPHTPYERLIYAEGMDRGILPETYGVVLAAMASKGHPGFQLSQTELSYIGALYDGGVTMSDRHVGRLLAKLEALDLADDTLIVVTSDHGEDLGERSPPRPGNHGHALWDPLILVPLIIFDPTRSYPLGRVTAQVRSIDSLPTVLDLLDVPGAIRGTGRSLAPLMRGEEKRDRLAWAVLDPRLNADRPVQYAVRSATHKLIVTAKPLEDDIRSVELFDLVADPGERTDIAAEAGDQVDVLMPPLERLRKRLEAGGSPYYKRKGMLSPAATERLRELGYIE